MRGSQSAEENNLFFRAPSAMFWAGFLIRVLYITIVLFSIKPVTIC